MGEYVWSGVVVLVGRGGGGADLCVTVMSFS